MSFQLDSSYIENTRWVSFDIKFTRQGFENACWHREACRAIQHAFSKPGLETLISKDANLVFYLSVYPLLNTLQTFDFCVDSASLATSFKSATSSWPDKGNMPWDRWRLLGYVETIQLILGVTDNMRTYAHILQNYFSEYLCRMDLTSAHLKSQAIYEHHSHLVPFWVSHYLCNAVYSLWLTGWAFGLCFKSADYGISCVCCKNPTVYSIPLLCWPNNPSFHFTISINWLLYCQISPYLIEATYRPLHWMITIHEFIIHFCSWMRKWFHACKINWGPSSIPVVYSVITKNVWQHVR